MVAPFVRTGVRTNPRPSTPGAAGTARQPDSLDRDGMVSVGSWPVSGGGRTLCVGVGRLSTRAEDLHKKPHKALMGNWEKNFRDDVPVITDL